MNKFRKSLLAAAMMAAGCSSAYAVAPTTPTCTTINNNFTMLDPGGGLVGGSALVTFKWDGTYNTNSATPVVNASLASPDTFFGYNWVAHDVQIFAPANYPSLNGYVLNVGANQLGVSMLFDWGAPDGTTACGKANCNIQVVELCQLSTQFQGAGQSWDCASVDPLTPNDPANGYNDGFSGIAMNNGPFVGFNANFNVMGCQAGSGTPVGIPAAPSTLAVSSVTPTVSATNQPINTALTVTFNHAVANVTATTFTLSCGGTPVTGTVSGTGASRTFTPGANLPGSASCTASLASSIQDALLLDKTLTGGYSWSFTTAATADTTPPTLSSKTPANGATSVATGTAITATFSEAMNTATVSSAFTVKDAANTAVTGTVSSTDSTTFTFTPASVLQGGTTYTATVSTAAQDSAGNAIAATQTWSFTTVTQTSVTVTGKTVGVSSGNIVSMTPMTTSSLGGTPPAGVLMGDFIDYKVNGIASGGSVTVTLDFGSSIVGKDLYKFRNGAYEKIPESAFTRVNSTTISMTMTDDNGTAGYSGYDTDTTAGVIHDPIGAGIPPRTIDSAGSAAGGGCASNQNGGNDASLLVALLAGLGYVGWRRRQSN